jgi:hypothetical protein
MKQMNKDVIFAKKSLKAKLAWWVKKILIYPKLHFQWRQIYPIRNQRS